MKSTNRDRDEVKNKNQSYVVFFQRLYYISIYICIQRLEKCITYKIFTKFHIYVTLNAIYLMSSSFLSLSITSSSVVFNIIHRHTDEKPAIRTEYIYEKRTEEIKNHFFIHTISNICVQLPYVYIERKRVISMCI